MGENILAGWCGGCAGIVVGHPFDTVKVRLQTQSFGGPQYKGLLHCFSSIIKQESVIGLQIDRQADRQTHRQTDK
jgi:solute carrier family 25 carnitine/acylcarnitine transporter 20/29